MSDYSQPAFYKFSEDSIKLVRFALKYAGRQDRVADLCAGCGIIGIEVAKIINAAELELVELQNTYLPHLERNVQLLPESCKRKISMTSLKEWRPLSLFDLVVCNPPYFLPGRGEPSQSPEKDLARRFSVDGWEVLIERIKGTLTPQGKALLVVPDDNLVLNLVEKLSAGCHLNFAKHKQESSIVFLELRHQVP